VVTRGLPTLFSGKDGDGIIYDDPKLPSTHSGYPCVIGCGDEGVTPAFTEYYNPLTGGNDELQNFYSQINTDPSISNVYNPNILSGGDK